jgi:hypothetical protein
MTNERLPLLTSQVMAAARDLSTQLQMAGKRGR